MSNCLVCVLSRSDSLQPYGLYSLLGSSVHGDSPGKNTGVGCHALLWGIFLTQGLNPWSPALQADSFLSEPPGKHWYKPGVTAKSGSRAPLCAHCEPGTSRVCVSLLVKGVTVITA